MTLVLPFGVRRIHSGEEHAIGEMRDAHRYYNALVAIERWRRREYAAIRSRYVPGLAELEHAYELLNEWIGEHSGRKGQPAEGGQRAKIRGKRQRARTRRVDVDHEVDVIGEMKRWRKDASAQLKPRREQFSGLVRDAERTYEARVCGVPREWIDRREELRDAKTPEGKRERKALVERIQASAPKTHARAAANTRVREEMLGEDWHPAWKDLQRLQATEDELWDWMQSAHSLNHGTYWSVRQDVERAGKRPPPRPDGEPRKPRTRPAFRDARIHGDRKKIGWQLQAKPTWGAIVSGRCNNLRVANIRKAHCGHLADAALRITTPDGDRWVAMTIAVHRPVPDDTKISWVYLVPQKRPHERWEYSLQLTAEPTRPLVQRGVGTGHVHLDLRWTQVGETLEIARVNGEPLVLPPKTPSGKPGPVPKLRHAERLRGYADEHFDVARAETRKRLSGLPERVRAMCAGIEHWRAHAKLSAVSVALRETLPDGVALRECRQWDRERLRDGVDTFAPFDEFARWAESRGLESLVWFPIWLETWRRKDKHLEQMADGTRRRGVLARREFYRVTAARLASEYETYSLGGAVDLRALALRDKDEDQPRELHQAARHNRQLAGLYELKQALKQAFGSDRYRERSGDGATPGTARDGENGAGSGAPPHAAE